MSVLSIGPSAWRRGSGVHRIRSGDPTAVTSADLSRIRSADPTAVTSADLRAITSADPDAVRYPGPSQSWWTGEDEPVQLFRTTASTAGPGAAVASPNDAGSGSGGSAA